MCIYCCDYNYKFSLCKQVSIKRFFLPLIGVFALAALPAFRHFIYLPIVVFLGSVILFWNFPFIIFYSASKPFYYEDLFIDEKKIPNYEVDKHIKHKFKTILEIVLIITNAILTGALADYYLYKTTGNESYMKVLGITGGIIKIFQMINNFISWGILNILKQFVIKENTELKKKQIESVENIIRLKRHDTHIWNEIELPTINKDINIKISRERAETL